jgi:hypothetical protein
VIRATFTPGIVATDATAEARTVAGVAVPWDTPGTVSDGTTVIFRPGSLDASARPVLLRDHDSARPLGRVIGATATPTGMQATARIARTRDGDEALVLAAPPDQVLGMFSVGVDPTDWTYDQAGTMYVHAADWHELSLLTMGAFSDARVATVTASTQGESMDLTAAIAELDPEPVDPDEVDPDAPVEDDDDETKAELVPVLASRAAAVPLRAAAGAHRRPAGLDLRGVATIMAAGFNKQAAAPRIQAALTNVKTTDVPGVVPHYRGQLVQLIDTGMPLVNAIGSAPLPPYGMAIDYPTWTAPPSAYAIVAGEKVQIPSGPVTMGNGTTNVETWAQGNDISFQTAMRSDPSFVELYLQGCSIDAGRKYDTHVATALLAGATAATLPTTVTFVNCVMALYAALNPATTPPGPLFLAMSWDVQVAVIGVTGLNGPAFWNMSMTLGDAMPASAGGGLDMFVDPNLPAKTMLLGSKAAATSYGGPSTSADVRVVDVGLLGYDIGVYFFAALAITHPTAFVKLTGVTLPLSDDGPATTSSKSK